MINLMKSSKKPYSKILVGVLIILVIVSIGVFLYMKKDNGKHGGGKVSAQQTQWSTVGSSTTCSSPWTTGTTYTISIQDPGFPETSRNSVALGPIVASLATQTCPTIQIIATGVTDVSMISVTRTPAFKTAPTITAGKTAGIFVFTDSDNPYSGPPISSDVTVGKSPWSKKTTDCKPAVAVCAPWKIPTYYRMTYSDKTGVESVQLSTSLKVGPDLQNNNPNLATTPVSGYTMNVYRSTDGTNFTKIGEFDSTGSYTDNANPYQGPNITPVATCQSWNDGSTCTAGPPPPSSLICSTSLWKMTRSGVITPFTYTRPVGGGTPSPGCTSVSFETSSDGKTWTPSPSVMNISTTAPFSATWGYLTTPDTTTSPITLTDTSVQGVTYDFTVAS